MYVPFPAINSGLALQSHMYVCMRDGLDKEFIKCQTFKPTHLISSNPPYQYLVEEVDTSRNPFLRKTTIDCDKSFCVSNATLDLRLLAQRNVCSSLFTDIINKIRHMAFRQVTLNPQELSNINPWISHP